MLTVHLHVIQSVDERVLATQSSTCRLAYALLHADPCAAVLFVICCLQVIRDRETRAHRGYGFVTFANPGSAQAAIGHLNGMAVAGPFQGRQLKVSPSTKAR
jgi:hypothetical protein